jgi:DNA-binding NarL/FixJ family response regulator
MPFPIASRTAVLLDRHPLWLDAVETVMRRLRVEVVAKTTVPERALALVEERRPDIFAAGLEAEGDEMDAAACVKAARRRHHGVRAVVLGSSRKIEHIDAALAAGAVAYVAKAAHSDDIAAAFRQVFDRSIYLAPSVMSGASVERVPDSGLTRRELEILKLAAAGHSNAELAQMLWVTSQTVKFHLSNIYRKLDVANRNEASQWARRTGLVDDGQTSPKVPPAHPASRSVRATRQARPTKKISPST